MGQTTYRSLFGKGVRSRRLQMGISQEKLAFRCGLHRTYIGAVERGEKNISLDNIVKLAIALDVQPSTLMPRLEDVISGV